MKSLSLLTTDQLAGIPWIESRTESGIWGDVGTGKTCLCLTALLNLRRRFEIDKVLVVGPRLVAERVWAAEVNEWEHLVGQFKVVKIIGTPAQRLAALEQDGDIYTITRDQVKWLEKQFIEEIVTTLPNGTQKITRRQFKRAPWDTLVLDECQSFSHQDTNRFDSMRRLRKLFRRVILLTGSLIPNGRKGLWSQMYLVDQGRRLGASENAFKKRWFRKEVNDGIVSFEELPHAAEEIDKAISDIFYVVRDPNPPAPRNIIKVGLTKAEAALYNKMRRTSVLEIGGKEITAVNSGVLWGKLLQMANGALYTDADHSWTLIHDQKLEALVELLESIPGKVIIGYGFRHDLARLQERLAKTGRRVGVLRTNRSLDDWRDGKLDIGIMHPASAGHGLNDLYVSGAENLIWFGLTPNREFFEQLNGRLAGGHRRAGRKVVIHIIVTEGTIDEEALELIDFKGDTAVEAQKRVIRWVKEARHADDKTAETRSEPRHDEIVHSDPRATARDWLAV